jgi:hypothetical protein
MVNYFINQAAELEIKKGFSMNIEIDTLVETYSILKQYIPVKDRQEASDNLMSVLVDLLGDADLNDFATIDQYTKRSYQQYNLESDGDDEDHNYED